MPVFAPKVYQCRRAPGPLELDGNLDKPFWEGASWTCDFADIEGDIRPAPRYRTRAKMLWDDQNLYIGAELMGEEIWPTSPGGTTLFSGTTTLKCSLTRTPTPRFTASLK